VFCAIRSPASSDFPPLAPFYRSHSTGSLTPADIPSASSRVCGASHPSLSPLSAPPPSSSSEHPLYPPGSALVERSSHHTTRVSFCWLCAASVSEQGRKDLQHQPRMRLRTIPSLVSVFFSVEFPRAVLTPRGVLCFFPQPTLATAAAVVEQPARMHKSKSATALPQAISPSSDLLKAHHTTLAALAGPAVSSAPPPSAAASSPALAPAVTGPEPLAPTKQTHKKVPTRPPRFPPLARSGFSCLVNNMTPNPPKFSMFPRTIWALVKIVNCSVTVADLEAHSLFHRSRAFRTR
jgi:hypothetical protein